MEKVDFSDENLLKALEKNEDIQNINFDQTVLGSSLVENVVNKQKENIPPNLEEPISKRRKTNEYDKAVFGKYMYNRQPLPPIKELEQDKLKKTGIFKKHIPKNIIENYYGIEGPKGNTMDDYGVVLDDLFQNVYSESTRKTKISSANSYLSFLIEVGLENKTELEKEINGQYFLRWLLWLRMTRCLKINTVLTYASCLNSVSIDCYGQSIMKDEIDRKNYTDTIKKLIQNTGSDVERVTPLSNELFKKICENLHRTKHLIRNGYCKHALICFQRFTGFRPVCTSNLKLKDLTFITENKSVRLRVKAFRDKVIISMIKFPRFLWMKLV
jgi:hypothetical protein